MNAIQYEGFLVQAMPRQGENGWSINIHIIRLGQHHPFQPGKFKSRHFFTNDVLPTEDEAIIHCFGFGKQIIDGEIESWSVNEL